VEERKHLGQFFELEWNGIVSRVFANYFVDRFPSFSWSIRVLDQLGFIEIEFSLLF